MRALLLGTLFALSLALACALSLTALPTPAHAAGAWEFIGTDAGVRVFRKEVPGSDVFAFRGETTANVHIGKLLAVFFDKSQRKHWVDRYADSKTLDNPNRMLEVYWIKFELPFPVSNRDYVLRADGIADEAKRVFTAKIKSVVDARKPPDDCCVRAQAYGTFYRFEAIPGTEKTKIVVEVHTDPKGILPDWLVNMIQKKWPAKTLSGLIARAARTGQAALPEYATWHAAEAPAAPPAPAPGP